MKLWKQSRVGDSSDAQQVRAELKKTAERYAARIPGLEPRTWDHRHACGDLWALLGDAAGFADPGTRESIYYSLRSAELFSEGYLARSPFDYEETLRHGLCREFHSASHIPRKVF